ncbi:MAG: hypothetical protein KUG73_03405 [Pseudomonadales bacterium]|nr:hypothetical protein [Pseudomonadales bacterium]
MKNIRWFLLALNLFPLTLMADMKGVEHSIEAEKALYFFDEPTGTGRIIAFSCVSCSPVSLAYFKNIKVKVDGSIIDSEGLGRYSGYSATIFFNETSKTAIRINVGEKSTSANSPPPPPPRRVKDEK